MRQKSGSRSPRRAIVTGAEATYRIEYSREAVDHLRALSARQQRIVLDSVDQQLPHEPTKRTRNRKPLEPNPLASWALRLGNLRVYYDVKADPEPLVLIRAVGVKVRDKVRLGSEGVEI